MTLQVQSVQNRDSAVFDRAAILDLVGGDRELLREIVALFLETAPNFLQGIRDAAARGDGIALKTAAHALRGAARNFFAPRIEQAAQVLEQMGERHALQGALSACAALAAELDTLRPLLLSMLREGENGT